MQIGKIDQVFLSILCFDRVSLIHLKFIVAGLRQKAAYKVIKNIYKKTNNKQSVTLLQILLRRLKPHFNSDKISEVKKWSARLSVVTTPACHCLTVSRRRRLLCSVAPEIRTSTTAGPKCSPGERKVLIHKQNFNQVSVNKLA